MLNNEKILVTGASGLVGMKLGRFLAENNEVWGLARFADPDKRAQVESAGMKPISADMGGGDFSHLPDDFTYVLHLSHTRRGADEFIEAIDINAVGAGLLLQHCRKAKAALVVSSTAVYSPPANVFHLNREDGDIGRAWAPWAPSSPVSKVSLEAVARFAAAAFNLPTVIMRLNTCYGMEGGMPVNDMKKVAAGNPIGTFADPYPHSPIHFDDMCDQIAPLLDAANTRGNIVNWCGDEVVTQRQWCEMAADFSGKTLEMNINPIPGTPNGNAGDTAKRHAITGPCRRPFRASMKAVYDGTIASVA